MGLLVDGRAYRVRPSPRLPLYPGWSMQVILEVDPILAA